jgi:hypothetical protein
MMCDTCRGSGRFSCFLCHGAGGRQDGNSARVGNKLGAWTKNWVECSACRGRGKAMCHTCCGDGRLDGLSKDCQAADLTEASAQSEVAGSAAALSSTSSSRARASLV